jgi:hypothetical protein
LVPKKIVNHISFVSSVGIRLFDIDFGFILFEFTLVLGLFESFLNFIFVFVF